MILSFLCTSCCTMATKPTEQVLITTQQSDVDVFIDGYSCGKAPLLAELDKKYDHQIVVSKTGYQNQETCITSHHTLKSGYNIAAPIAGAAIGTGVGLALFGTGGFILPYCIVGTLCGGAIGLGLGVVGTATDLYSRSDCSLAKNEVHFQLIQESQY